MIRLSPIVINGHSVHLPISGNAAAKFSRDLAASVALNDDVPISERLLKTPPLLIWCAAKVPQSDFDCSGFLDWMCCSASDILYGDSSNDVMDDFVATKLKRASKKYKRLIQSSNTNATTVVEALACYLACFDGMSNQQSQDWLTGNTWLKQMVDNRPSCHTSCESIQNRMHKIEDVRRIILNFEEQLQLEKLASMKQLAYGASHEINNPLANIASRAQVLISDESDPDRKRRLESINQQAFRAHEMIADLMLFAHPPKTNLQAIDAFPVVEKIISELRPMAEEQNTELTCHTLPTPQILADSTQLGVAIKAVVTNALEAVRENGEVKVEMRSGEEDFASITVRDDGPGFDDLAKKHMFDPFFSGREAGRGLGFGLAKAWRIVQQHGGKIEAESLPHSGAAIHLRIPYAKAG